MFKDGKLNLGMLRGMKVGDIPAEEILVKKTDDLNTVYQKYILCASKGIHPHAGKKLTAVEKNKFLYAGMVTPVMEAFGQAYGARMVKKMADTFMSDSVTRPSDFASEPFLPEEYYKKNYSSMDGVPNSKIEFNKLGSSGNIEKTIIIYDKQGKQSIRIDYCRISYFYYHFNLHYFEITL
ncbi:hypothetical protein [uncultured Vagococcus sp.]|uniref:hypothetical protein n=1 Tax=uncultured Vagococcus sp. TaxID=189676 RepID=UPI0028D0E6A6|nr:hypothetical protein [uncultured Vagococcus sp.]